MPSDRIAVDPDQAVVATGDESASLSKPWSIVAAHRLQVIVLTGAFAIAYAVAIWLNASYVARAILRTPDLTLAEFKRVAEAASDPAVIAEAAQRIFREDGARIAAARDLAGDPSFSDHFIPIYSISRSDLRETSVAPPTTAGQQIVAVQAWAESRDRSTAGKMAFLLGDAFADGALKSALVEYVTTQHGTTTTSRERLEAKIASDRALLERVETKIGALQKLNAAYPQASRDNSRQLVSIADGGARYLSPVAQLIGASSEAIAVRDSISESERKIRQLTWTNMVLDQVAKLDVTAFSGRNYMAQLESLIGSSSANAAADDEAIREARLNVEGDLSVLRGRYSLGYTMLRAPAERPPRAGPSLLAHIVGGGIASLVLAILLTLGFHWKASSDESANP